MVSTRHAVPVVLLILLLDAIGFGIVLPVLPNLIVHLAHVTVAEASRIAGYMPLGISNSPAWIGSSEPKTRAIT